MSNGARNCLLVNNLPFQFNFTCVLSTYSSFHYSLGHQQNITVNVFFGKPIDMITVLTHLFYLFSPHFHVQALVITKGILLTLGCTRWGGGGGSPHKVFLEFFQDELLSRPAVFSSCVHIPKTHFDTSLVRIGCYGYELCRHK